MLSEETRGPEKRWWRRLSSNYRTLQLPFLEPLTFLQLLMAHSIIFSSEKSFTAYLTNPGILYSWSNGQFSLRDASAGNHGTVEPRPSGTRLLRTMLRTISFIPTKSSSLISIFTLSLLSNIVYSLRYMHVYVIIQPGNSGGDKRKPGRPWI